MSVVTRFAPSPTGFLHIGSARTSLFNYLFAKKNGGKFLLRVEDTDRKRSTKEAVDVILNGLKWLGLKWDEEAIFQTSQLKRHQEVAELLLEQGKAYQCYCSAEELKGLREEAEKHGKKFKYDRRWRDKKPDDKSGLPDPVVRIKAPLDGKTIIEDKVHGRVEIDNCELDDFVILRADGTPTYMLSVVVDDHDVGITNIVRGDDHFTNSFRQKVIYDALGWQMPKLCHIPLINGADGKKLSKRHGALSVLEYKKMGFLSEAMCNYLLRLGWSHGDDEIITMETAKEWFDLEHIGRSPACFNVEKLRNLNHHYITVSDDKFLLKELEGFFESNLSEVEEKRILRGMAGLKERSYTLVEMAENAQIYLEKNIISSNFEQKERGILSKFKILLEKTKIDSSEDGQALIKKFVEIEQVKFKEIGLPLRIALTGQKKGPSIGEVIYAFGKEETLKRIS